MLSVIKENCSGCGLCVKKCPFAALELKDDIVAINDEKCTLCGACVESCNFSALEIDDVDHKRGKINLASYKGVWVLAEQRDNQLLNVSLELISEGRKLADQLGTELSALLIGGNVKTESAKLIVHGADRVYLVEHKELKDYRTNPYARITGDLIQKYKPEIVLIGATHNGRDLGPRLSARLQTGLTADCTKLEIDEEKKILLQTRPAFGGNLMATIICPEHRPQMATVRPGIMAIGAADSSRTGEIININVNFNSSDLNIEKEKEAKIIKINGEDLLTKIKEIIKEASQSVNLEDADIIVAGGRGVGSPDGFSVIKNLASQLNAEVAASRAVVDEGWIDKEHQVGQTGKSVKPKLYIACGISGAIQHRAGMENSDIIVAINKDKDAPIFKICDYGIVGDLHELLPLLQEALSLDRAS